MQDHNGSCAVAALTLASMRATQPVEQASSPRVQAAGTACCFWSATRPDGAVIAARQTCFNCQEQSQAAAKAKRPLRHNAARHRTDTNINIGPLIGTVVFFSCPQSLSSAGSMSAAKHLGNLRFSKKDLKSQIGRESTCASIKTATQMGIKTRGDLLGLPTAGRCKCAEWRWRPVQYRLHRETSPIVVIDKVMEAVPPRPVAERCIRAMVSVSENSKFAEALARSRWWPFIGRCGCHRKDGDKITSKKIARRGRRFDPSPLHGTDRDADEGGPRFGRDRLSVMIKASAGVAQVHAGCAWKKNGGPRGFRILEKTGCQPPLATDRIFIEEIRDAAAPYRDSRCCMTAMATRSTGRAGLMLEVRAATQKVTKRRQAPFLDAATRKANGRTGLCAGAAVGLYLGGKTVEFIVDGGSNFFSSNMNTAFR